MKRFVKVRNWVTNNATLPGIADRGIANPIIETAVMAMVGR